MTDRSQIPLRRWIRELDWTDPALEWSGNERVRNAMLELGAPEGAARQLVLLVEYAPGIRVEAHGHASDYLSIVVGGSVTIGREEHSTASIRLVAAGTVYGPLVAGPEGTRFVDVYTRHDGVFPIFPRIPEGDEGRVERLHEDFRVRLAALQRRPATRSPLLSGD